MPIKKNNEKKYEKSLKLIAKSSLIVFVILFFSKIITYIYRIIIARYFGPQIYGLFSLGVIILGLFVAFSSLGLSKGILRYIPFYRGKKQLNKIRYIFRFSSIILLLSSIIFGLLMFFLSEFISLTFFDNPDLIIFLKFFSILIPIFLFSNFFLAVIRAYEKISWYSFIFNILQNFVKLTLIILLIFIGFKDNAIILSYMGGLIAMLLASYLVCKYKISEIFGKSHLKNKIKRKIISNLFLYSSPLIFSTIFANILTWIDSLAIGYFKGVIEVGFYNAIVPLAFLIYISADIFMQLFYPLTTKEFSRKNFAIIKQLSQQTGKWILLLNLPILCILLLFPETIINILFGAQYVIASNSLRILSMGIFFLAIGNISTNLINMKGKSHIILINMIIVSIINLFLNIILVPKYGINGAAISTTFSYAILSLMLILETKYYLSIIPLKRKMFKILLISLVPLIILIYLRSFFPINFFSLIMQGILFLLIYIFLILITNTLNQNDLIILKIIKDKIKNLLF